MTSIERTAYPRFIKEEDFNDFKLETYYTITQDELAFILESTRGDKNKLNIAVQLKVFQNLRYFVDEDEISDKIINYLKHTLNVHHLYKHNYRNSNTIYQHREKIRKYLEVKKWDQTSQRFAIEAAYQASHTMNTPADIINYVIDTLIKNKYELPTFNQLDRLVRHVKHTINDKIFRQITSKLKADNMLLKLDQLLILPNHYNRTAFDSIKQIPKSPSIKKFKELLQHYNWLMTFGDTSIYINDIAKVKLEQFAGQAKTLDASDLKNLNENTRYSLMITLIHNTQQNIKDALATTYCKTIFKMHKDASKELQELREEHAESAHKMAKFLIDLSGEVAELGTKPLKLAKQILAQYEANGGVEKITEQCHKVAAYNSKNHLPLLWKYFKSKRSVVFELVKVLDLQSSSQDDSLVKAIHFLLNNSNKKAEHLCLNEGISLTFASDAWSKLISDVPGTKSKANRRYLELCIFTYIANELRSGDLYIEGANSFGDYRKDLLKWEDCLSLLNQYCEEVNLPSNSKDFVAQLHEKLKNVAENVDNIYPALSTLVIDAEGNPVLKRQKKVIQASSTLLTEVKSRMPDRNLMDILCNSQQYTGWAGLFGPIAGSEPKIENAIERYIINTFCNGTGMGPAQTARHVKSDITAHTLSWINRRHVNLKMLDAALVKIINYSNSFNITKALGDEKKCAADGTLRNIFEDNLISETHIRYGNRGGIAYHHIADNYIALFSTFISCGVWEAIEIIEGLLKNKSEIQPDTIHADTQGQSTPVFGLSYLFSIKLMPRIRNWKDLIFFRPEKTAKYKHIDSLFGDVIDWKLIETHWQDLMQVALSIKQGKISSSILLRKLNNYSRKNRLYLAFQELGRVIRTIYLLGYISDPKLRDTITESTNKVEAYNGLSEWVLFGSNYIVASNDAEEMEKAIKYNMIITNSIILQNLIDMSQAIYHLQSEGRQVTKEEISRLSPYMTEHIKRFGEYTINLNPISPISENIRGLTMI